MQFNGETGRKGVRLQFVLVRKGKDWERYNGPGSHNPTPDSTSFTEPADTYTCATCGRTHARIAVAWRRPVGMWGQWVVFRYNGSEHVPDLSTPIDVFTYPRGSQLLTDEESSRIWHSS